MNFPHTFLNPRIPMDIEITGAVGFLSVNWSLNNQKYDFLSCTNWKIILRRIMCFCYDLSVVCMEIWAFRYHFLSWFSRNRYFGTMTSYLSVRKLYTSIIFAKTNVFSDILLGYILINVWLLCERIRSSNKFVSSWYGSFIKGVRAGKTIDTQDFCLGKS